MCTYPCTYPEDKGAYFCEEYHASLKSGKTFSFLAGRLDAVSGAAVYGAWRQLNKQEQNIDFMFYLDGKGITRGYGPLLIGTCTVNITIRFKVSSNGAGYMTSY